jgi:hypothetical protein
VCRVLGYNNGFFCARSESNEDGGLLICAVKKDVNFKNKIESYGGEGVQTKTIIKICEVAKIGTL